MLYLKRAFREIKSNFATNLVFIVIISLSIMLGLGFKLSNDGVINSIKTFFRDYNLEQGQFLTLEKINIEEIKGEFTDLDIEEMKYVDYEIKEGTTLRIYQERERVNNYEVIKGEHIKNKGEIVVEDWFFSKNDLSLGQVLNINSKDFKGVGQATSPDYIYTLKNTDDMISDNKTFSIAFISKDDFTKFKEQKSYYSFKFKNEDKEKNKELKRYIQQRYKILYWINGADNGRFNNVINDIEGPGIMANVVTLLLIIIISIIIGLTIKKRLEEESRLIGAYYSLGYKRSELLRQYLIVPVILVTISAIIGVIAGKYLAEPLAMLQKEQYSFPVIKIQSSIKTFFTIIVPAIFVVILINGIIIGLYLKKKPLELLRGVENNKVSTLEKSLNLDKLTFNSKFRVRESLRNIPGILVLFIGVLIPAFLLNFSFGCKDSIDNFAQDTKTNITYPYLTLISEEGKLNSSDEKVSMESFTLKSKDVAITVQGIEQNSKYMKLKDLEGKDIKIDKTVFSSAIAKKYGINKGEEVNLYDEEEDREYKVKVEEICDYNAGLYIFMDRKDLNNLTKRPEGFYNGIFSEEPLNKNSVKIYKEISHSDMVKSIESFTSVFIAFSIILVTLSVVIAVGIIYLIMKLIMDKNKGTISLMKILGYDDGEVGTLFLKGNLIIVILGFIIGTVGSKPILQVMFDEMTANIKGYIEVAIDIKSIIISGVVLIASYYISNYFIKKSILKVSYNEVLKNRE